MTCRLARATHGHVMKYAEKGTLAMLCATTREGERSAVQKASRRGVVKKRMPFVLFNR